MSQDSVIGQVISIRMGGIVETTHGLAKLSETMNQLDTIEPLDRVLMIGMDDGLYMIISKVS